MRKRRLNQFGLYESVLAGLRFRFNTFEGTPPSGNGGGEVPDVEPVNGGDERSYDSLANGEVNDSDNPGTFTQSSSNSTPADPNQRAGALPAGGQQGQPQWQSARDYALAQGFQFDGTVTDDRTALNFLMAQAGRNRQADAYAQLGRQLAPESARIQEFLSQRTTPQVAQPNRQPWEAPEFDERWAGLVEQDPGTGLFTSKQGVPHEIAQKVNAYVEWKKGYDRNPAAVINGMVEQRAKSIAQETFREQFAAQRREQTVNAIVQENSAWLYQVDAGGQRLRDYQGQFLPTPVGAAYLQQLQAVRQMGVVDPRQQDSLAKQLVRGQYAQAYQAQAQAAAGQSGNVQTQQAVNRPNVNPLQAQPPLQRRANPAATEPTDAGLSLAERLRRDLAAEGVSDQDVFNSSGQ